MSDTIHIYLYIVTGTKTFGDFVAETAFVLTTAKSTIRVTRQRNDWQPVGWAFACTQVSSLLHSTVVSNILRSRWSIAGSSKQIGALRILSNRLIVAVLLLKYPYSWYLSTIEITTKYIYALVGTEVTICGKGRVRCTKTLHEENVDRRLSVVGTFAVLHGIRRLAKQ